jgi:hypothetical protein
MIIVPLQWHIDHASSALRNLTKHRICTLDVLATINYQSIVTGFTSRNVTVTNITMLARGLALHDITITNQEINTLTTFSDRSQQVLPYITVSSMKYTHTTF